MALHGNFGGLGQFGQKPKFKGVWSSMVSSFDMVDEKGWIPHSMARKIVGKGDATYFWKEVWIGGVILCHMFPRLFVLDSNEDCLVLDRWVNGEWCWRWKRRLGRGAEMVQFQELVHLLANCSFSDKLDKWEWELATDCMFVVGSVRRHIDDSRWTPAMSATRWNRFVPIKVNVLIWRIMLNGLPSKLNLLNRGMDIPSALCQSCGNIQEDVDHIFWACDISFDVWGAVFKWVDIGLPLCVNIVELLSWMDNFRLLKKRKEVLEVIILATIWMIWRFRNNEVFKSKKIKKSSLIDHIRLLAFDWLSSRNVKFIVPWTSWLHHPLNCIL